jgi:hypothetical protein
MSDGLAYSLIQIVPILYLVLQIGALIVMRGRLRLVARICAWTMGGVVLFVIYGTFVAQSNLAPIWIVFASPALLLVLIVLWVLHFASGRPSDRP